MAQKLISVALLLGLTLHAGHAVAADTSYRAGVASTAITPTEPTWMGGYAARTQPADGKIHDLYASALSVQDAAGFTLVFISLETPHLPRELADGVARALETRYRLAREQIVIACTHTHCGPALFGGVPKLAYPITPEHLEVSRRYAEQLEAKLIEIAGQAIESMRPAELAHAVGRCSFAVNRRNNREADAAKEGFVPVGPVDHDVPVLCVRSDGKVRAILFGYACHCTTLAIQQWCGDYAGFARQTLQDLHPGATALFVPGCGGDINPIPRRSLELCRDYGRQLADAVQRVLAEPMRPIEGRFRASWKEIELEFAHTPTREELNTAASSTNALHQRWASYLLGRLDAGESLPKSYSYPIQVIRPGDDLLLVFLAGEAVVDYALRLKRELGPGRTWPFAYANDMCGYIPSERVLREGGYEGRDSMLHGGRPSPWAAGLEDRIVSTVRDLADRLSGRPADSIP